MLCAGHHGCHRQGAEASVPRRHAARVCGAAPVFSCEDDESVEAMAAVTATPVGVVCPAKAVSSVLLCSGAPASASDSPDNTSAGFRPLSPFLHWPVLWRHTPRSRETRGMTV